MISQTDLGKIILKLSRQLQEAAARMSSSYFVQWLDGVQSALKACGVDEQQARDIRRDFTNLYNSFCDL